jgi:PAS domain S-box-containing protein
MTEMEQKLLEMARLIEKLESENKLLKEKEATIQESENLFSEMFHKSPVAIAITIPYTGEIIDVNQTFLSEMEYTREEVIGKTTLELEIFDDLNPRDNLNTNLKEQGSLYGLEIGFRTKSRKLLKGLLSIVFIQIKGQTYQLSTVINITERNLAEVEMIQTKERLRRAELASKSGNWEIHLDSKTVIASEGATIIYGIEKDHFNYSTILDIPLPEFRSLLDNAFDKLINENQPYDVEFKIKAVDTGVIKDLHSVAFYDKDKRVLFGVIQDITERKQVKEAQEFLLQCGLPSTGEDFFESLARYLATTLNVDYVCIDRLEGDGLNAQTVAIFNDGVFETNVKYALKDTPCGKVVENKFCSYQHGVQELFPRDEALQELHAESYYGTTLWDSKGKPIGLIAIIGHNPLYDPKRAEELLKLVSPHAAGELERRQSEEALQESETRLHELNATKDKFFSIIAHDLKSPFNSIIGFSSLLAEQIQEKNYEGIEEYAGIIQNSSHRAMDLLMNLLEWSSSQTGRMEFNPEYTEMVSLINDVMELSRGAALQKSITISKNFPQRSIAFADKEMTSAILRNLISNAVKFTKPGGEIVITTEQSQNELTVTVHDNGVGIKKNVIEKLFRIDENYSTLGTQNEKGTGLGLILCKEFVEKQGGKIWVKSEPGKGTSFSFTLPTFSN